MVLRKRESRSPPSYFQVEALPARLLGGLFVSFCRVNAALFRRPNAALLRRVTALLRRVCDALCFARLGVGAFAPCRPPYCSRKRNRRFP